jgi:hypothetical protein
MCGPHVLDLGTEITDHRELRKLCIELVRNAKLSFPCPDNQITT